MIKMKKLFAVVLAIAMLFTMSSIAASAETAPTVSISANKTTFGVGEKVELNVNVENAGAVDFTLNYDANVFEYVTATFTNTVNKKADSIKAVDGGIRVFLLDSDATLTFKAIGAAENANFAVEKATASNEDGTNKYDVVPTVPAAITVTEAGHIEVLGATTRATANINEQDLGFIGKLYVPEGKTVEKFGIIAAFTNELNKNSVADADFTLDTIERLNTETTKIVAHKEVADPALISTILEGEGDGKFTSHVKTTGSYDLMGKNITARFYVQFTDSEEVIYSNNISVVNGAVVAEDGVAKKSMVQVLASQITSICNAAGATKEMADEAAQVVAAYNADKNDTTKEALLKYVDKYAEDFLLG